jgi:hypothetical protein
MLVTACCVFSWNIQVCCRKQAHNNLGFYCWPPGCCVTSVLVQRTPCTLQAHSSACSNPESNLKLRISQTLSRISLTECRPCTAQDDTKVHVVTATGTLEPTVVSVEDTTRLRAHGHAVRCAMQIRTVRDQTGAEVPPIWSHSTTLKQNSGDFNQGCTSHRSQGPRNICGPSVWN